MSHFTTITTEFKDRECLIQALYEIKNPKTQAPFRNVHSYDSAIHLKGYRGDTRLDSVHASQTQTAEIVIKKENISRASNDIGFKRNAQGIYEAIISEFDRAIGFNTQWLNQLQKIYSEKVIYKKAAQLGATVEKKVLSNGKIQFQVKPQRRQQRTTTRQFEQLTN